MWRQALNENRWSQFRTRSRTHQQYYLSESSIHKYHNSGSVFKVCLMNAKFVMLCCGFIISENIKFTFIKY